MKNMGRYIGSIMMGMMLALSAVAAEQAGRNFNHATTGFPLTGAHLAAACETCHVGGVFKGTPRACEGCHAVGQRVVATPKNDKHIVTDAPCDTCHFNTATWLGARYNHGAAIKGQCASCHNGRQAAGRPGSHHAGKKATESCDSCHRTFAWMPASWNHTNTAADCETCHNGSDAFGRSAGHLTLNMPPVSFVGNCRACHTSYVNFYAHYYNHAGAPTTCQTCHGNLNGTGGYAGVHHPSSPIHTAAPVQPLQCNACHKSFGVWGGRFDHVGATSCTSCHDAARTYEAYGIRGMPASHGTFFNYNPATTQCSVCHSTASWGVTISGPTLHSYLVKNTAPHTPTCRSCHNGRNHDGREGANASMDCSQSGCHAPAGGKGLAYVKWD